MEMPELFGNAYVLPAIIVVVLLLIMLLVLMLRKRRATSPVSFQPVDQATEPLARLSPRQASETPDASFDLSAQTPEVVPTPTSAAETLAVTSLTGLSRSSTPPDDPLHTVIMEVMQGWGDLTSEDTNRLELFRPEKILAAAENIELPKDHKGGDHARTRLLQIRQYATDRELRTERVQAAVDTTLQAPEAAAETRATETEVVEVAPLAEAVAAAEATATVEAPPVAAAVVPEESVAEQATPVDEAAPQTDAAPVAESPPVEHPVAEEDVAVAATAEDFLSRPAEEEVFEDRATLERKELEAQVTDAPMFVEPAVPLLWTEDAVGWETKEPQPHQEAPEPAVIWPGEEPLAAVVETGQPSGAGDLIARAQTPRDSLSSLHGQVKTAEDLLALPPEERGDMLAFLEPSQLSKVFKSTDDPGIKKAVIDTLEHVGNPMSLDVLRTCLDDPDPEIQLYALDAADRLLGVE